MEAGVLLIPVGVLLLSAWLAYTLTRARENLIVSVLVIAAIGAGIWGIWMANQQSGYSGLGYVAFSLGMAAPACVGLLIGWLTGWGLNHRKNSGARRRVEYPTSDE